MAWLWLGFFSVSQGATNYSAWVTTGTDGRLIHKADPLGNRVLNYAEVGYKGGGVPIPVVQVKTNISPVAGDNRAHIQAAIDYVSGLPLGPDGFRGAVLLSAGTYPVASTLRINAGGVVLRGTGSGIGGTILNATASTQYTLVSIAGSGSASTVGGTTHDITNRYVPVGARSFQVDSTGGLAVGDRVFVRRVATSQWITDLGMDLLCCSPSVNPWTASGYHIDADRLITRIEGNRIFIDAPITTAIDRSYTNGTIRKYTWSGRIQNSAIESIRGVSTFTNATDENHAWTFVEFSRIEHGWARDIVSQYFGYSCVSLSTGAKWITVRDCQSLNPVSQVTGGRRYAFVLDDSTMCLVQNCYTHDDRHQFVTQSLTTGPHVFVDGRCDSARSDCGPHHRWGSGAIWDNITVNGNNLNIQNRGNLGSGHGWSGANDVVWNSDADGGYVVQNPPTARNWLIGSVGAIENGSVYVGPHDPGTYDSHGSNVFPNSLYYAQLQDRLAAPALQTREYWLGEIHRFTNSAPGGEVVPVDAAWRTTLQNVAGGAPLDNFDVVTANHWVPFTFNFALATNEQIVGASLLVSMLGAGTGTSNDLLYLDSVTNGLPLAALGWLPVSTAVSNPTVRALDLSAHLPLLADGRLNLAIQNDTAIDWALLQLEVGPKVDAGILALLPAADATVRGGANANSNFGTATTLTVKEDVLADNDRKAFLRWDLSSVTGIVYQAKVRLTPVTVGTNAIEQGVLVCTNDAWNETSITWNNQPVIGTKRFASWLPGANAPLEFTVTPEVLGAIAGDKQLSLQLISLRDVGGPGTVEYASREAADPNSRPQLLLLTVSSHPPATFVWNGPGAGSNNWSTGGNWVPGVPPESLDDIRFYDPGAAGLAASNINNVVDNGFGGVVASVHYANTNGNHSTLIAPGRKLNIQGAGGLMAGTGTDNGNTQAVQATIAGLAATLELEGGDLIVRQATDAATSSSQRATLNLSGLDNLTGSIGRIVVGSEGPFARVTGTLLLAKTNILSATGSPPAIAVGGQGGGNGNAGGASFLFLGRSNALFANTLAVGRYKQGVSGGATSAIRFNPAFTNLNPLLGGAAWFRAPDGISRMTSWTIADSSSGGGTVNTAGLCDFSGGIVDAKVGSLIIGKTSSGGGNGDPSGTLTFQAGTIDVNTVQLAVQSITSSNSATGTLNVYGGTVQINSLLQLGVVAGGTGVAANSANLAIRGGNVFANSLTIGAGGNSAVSVHNGSLTLSNAANNLLTPLGNLQLTNASLQLAARTNSVSLVCSNLVTGPGVNLIHIGSVSQPAAYPAQIQLIDYSGPIGGAGFNFVLASLPESGVCGGYLSNNLATSSIDLFLTNCAAPVFSQVFFTGTNLLLLGSGGTPAGAYSVLSSTNVAAPIGSWVTVGTGVFNGSGGFSFTNTVDANHSQRFYLIRVP